MSIEPSGSSCVFIKTMANKHKIDEKLEFGSAKIQKIDENISQDYENCFEQYNDEDMIVYSPQSVIFDYEHEDTSQDRLDTKEIFLQYDTCYLTSLEISQCRECKENKEDCNKYTCRFYQFRRIERENGKCRVVGFLDIHSDPTVADLDLWTTPMIKLNSESTNYILTYITSQFCEMVREELKISKSFKETNDQVAWKRAVYLVREMCDVCATSLFNYHFVCTKCGTSVCIDCYKEREAGFSRWKSTTKAEKLERDKFFWYKCHDDGEHKLMLTQMVPGDALSLLFENLHKVCKEQNIPLKCECQNTTKKKLKASSNVQKNFLIEKAMQKERFHKMRVNRTINVIENTSVFSRIHYTWVGGRNILKFLEPSETDESYKLFQSEWQKGKPVLVANVSNTMKLNIWKPDYFLSKFGNNRHSLVNCTNDTVIKRVPLKHFWEGFKSYKKRLPVDNDQKLVLKLKDFPTANDFADVLKDHFTDMMKTVPFGAYSKRDGKYNLPRYLHIHFLRPDLGPKMYSAYGQELPLRQGSTNLHLDISDAINVCVHVSKPEDSDLAPNQYKKEEVRKAMIAAGCDEMDLRIFDSNLKLPGAIWYIWKACQADAMRKVLCEVAKEKGKPLGKNEDPLHDQDCFIDEALRLRLKQNGVEGYTIIQYEGEAVFIPAGAPHQVTNLYDCIKVALDFVAPENIIECFNLTQEFRKLSTRHANREDKLQIKSILYHVVKCLIPTKREYEL